MYELMLIIPKQIYEKFNFYSVSFLLYAPFYVLDLYVFSRAPYGILSFNYFYKFEFNSLRFKVNFILITVCFMLNVIALAQEIVITGITSEPGPCP